MRMKLGKTLWMEDDSGAYDRERLWEACIRITGKKRENLTILEEEDGGDCTWLRCEEGIIICVSFPGNTGIYAVPGGEYDG